MPGIIERSFWRHPEIKHLSDTGKLLAAYLLTGPHHELIGCYYLPLAYVSADLSWTPKTTQAAAKSLEDTGYATWCDVTEIVLIPSWLRYHPIQNPNQGFARVSQVNALPRNFSNWELLRHTFDQLGGKHLPADWAKSFERFEQPNRNPRQQFLKGLPNGSPKGSVTIERERERDRERDRERVGAFDPVEVARAEKKLIKETIKPLAEKLKSKYPQPFERCWLIYPGRGGAGNSKPAAFRAWKARTRAGVLAEDLYQGTVRYRAWCDLEGNTDTKFTKAGSTFYGPDEHWTQPYDLTKSGKPIKQSALQAAWKDIEDSITH